MAKRNWQAGDLDSDDCRYFIQRSSSDTFGDASDTTEGGEGTREADYDHHKKAGNHGDIVKHVALTAALQGILTSLDEADEFHYADTFAGYPMSTVAIIPIPSP